MTHKPRLLIATNNKGKLVEIQDILKDLKIELVSPAKIGLSLDVTEDGQTYAENASKKALAFAQASGLLALADDTGLEVDALGGKPGLHSARYGHSLTSPIFDGNGEKSRGGRTDATRRAFLLENLNGKPHPWAAKFRATVAVASPEGNVEIVEGICPGEVIPEERGGGGFGYDPIFFIPELGLTMAELGMEEKNRYSHRGRAVRNVIPILKQLLGLD